MADRTVRAIFEAKVDQAKKGIQSLGKDAGDTGKKVDGLTKDLKTLDQQKVKPKIDVSIDDAKKRVHDLTIDLGTLRQMEVTPVVQADIKDTERKLAEARKALRQLDGAKAAMTVTADTSQAKREVDGLADDIGDAGKDGGDQAGEGIVSGILDALRSIPIAGAVVGVGAALAGGILLALKDGLSIESGRDLFSARTGLDEATSARFGRAAGEAYANAWGDSVEANLDTARLALQGGLIDADATDAEIENVIAKLQGISDLFDYDIATSVRGVGNLMKTGLVKDANQAFDLITAASQKVASDDLIDTLTEYSNQFVTLGLNGEQAFGLIAQAAAAGARDTDNIADTLKEMGLRIREGTQPALTALDQLGLNAKDIVSAFQKGGPDAVRAMGQVFDALRQMREDGGNTQAVITNLFGGPGEDLGAALFALDIDKVSDALGGVDGAAGAADRALKTMSDNTATKMEEAKRNIEVAVDGIKGALAEAFGDDISGAADWVSKNRAPLLQFFLDVVNGTLDAAEGFANMGATGLDAIASIANGFADLIDALPDWLIGGGDDLSSGLRTLATGASDAADEIRTNVPAALDEVRDKVNTWAAPELLKARVHDATVAMTEDMDAFSETVKNSGGEVTINGDTVNADEALDLLVENINAEDGTVTINGDKVPAEDALDVLIALINAGAGDVKVGADDDSARASLSALVGVIKGTSGAVKVNANTAAAERALRELEKTRYATLQVRVAGVNSVGGLAKHDGGWINKGLYSGGWVPGSDPGYDNVLWPLNSGGRTLAQPLAGGEFVVNSQDSAFWGPLLEWINGGGRPVQTFNETTKAPVYIDKVVGLTISEVEREAARRRRRDALSPSRGG